MAVLLVVEAIVLDAVVVAAAALDFEAAFVLVAVVADAL